MCSVVVLSCLVLFSSAVPCVDFFLCPLPKVSLLDKNQVRYGGDLEVFPERRCGGGRFGYHYRGRQGQPSCHAAGGELDTDCIRASFVMLTASLEVCRIGSSKGEHTLKSPLN